MAVATLNSHIDSAIRLQKQIDTAYFVFGRRSAWTDEENPPKEDIDTTELDELIGYKKLKQFSLARPLNPEEDISTAKYPVVTYRKESWMLVPKDKAYEEKARWVYAEAEIAPEDFPLGTYRQVGLNINVVPKSGINKLNLLPDEVSKPGKLQFFENREQQNITDNVYVTEQFMIKV